MIIISIIPAGLIGYFFENQISSLFDGNLILVGFMLIITAIILFFSDRVSDKKKKINFMSSVIIGISQAFAILPGISRSGSTICLLYTSPSPRDKRQSRMPSSA